jgi:hypothetical protein
MGNWWGDKFNPLNPIDLLAGVGYTVDTPYAMARNYVAKKPVTQGLFDPQQRTSGRDMLESLGVVGANQEGLDRGDVAGFAAEMLDPFTLALGAIKGPAAAAKAAKAAKGVGKLRKAATAAREIPVQAELANALVPTTKRLYRAGAVPSEIARKPHPWIPEDTLNVGGRWFDKEIGSMPFYARDNNALPRYVDVPAQSAEQWRVANTPAAQFSARPNTEYLLPENVANQVKPLYNPNTAKTPSVIPLPGPGQPRLPAPTPIFYSRLEKAVSNLKGKQFKEQSLRNMIRKAAPEGVADEEMDWVLRGLPSKGGVVSKDELVKHVKANAIQVEEKIFGNNNGPNHAERLIGIARGEIEYDPNNTIEYQVAIGNMTPAEGIKSDFKTNWGAYATPGGENYRELLLKMPRKDKPIYVDKWNPVPEGHNDYISGHWEDDPNVLAHIRFDDRIAPDGKKTLFIQEIQSDWHQAGAKGGYKGQWSDNNLPHLKYEMPDEGGVQIVDVSLKKNKTGYYWHDNTIDKPFSDVDLSELGQFDSIDNAVATLNRIFGEPPPVPDAPFKGTEWAELSMKRMLRYATENGYERIAWNNGELATQHASGVRGDVHRAANILRKWQGKTNSKEFKALLENDKNLKILHGNTTWYDETLPNLVGKMLKKEGGKFEPLPIGEGIVPSFTLPQATKKRVVNRGQPLLNLLPLLGAGVAGKAAAPKTKTTKQDQRDGEAIRMALETAASRR